MSHSLNLKMRPEPLTEIVWGIGGGGAISDVVGNVGLSSDI